MGNSHWDTFWKTISHPLTWVPLYAVLLYLLYRKYPIKQFLLLLIIIGLGVLVSDQLCNFFKLSIARLRPCHDPLLQKVIRRLSCGGKYGFYSGHSSNSFFIAQLMAFVFCRKWPMQVFLFSWASLVAYSRVYLGVHFPLDILMGSCMGYLLGGFFSRLFFYLKEKISFLDL